MFLIFLILGFSPIWAAHPCPKWSLGQLVGISPMIIEGRLRSHSDRNSTQLEANFQVKTVFKSDFEDFSKLKFLRLTFNSEESCPKKLKSVKNGGKFIIFAKHSRMFGFEPIVSPLKKTRRATKELYSALCSHQSQYCHKGKTL